MKEESESVPKMDDQLERRIEDFEMAVGDFLEDPAANEVRLTRARSALRSYLSEDTRRLDWLEQLPGAQICRTYDGGGSVLWWNVSAEHKRSDWKYPPLREAIDIATGFNNPPHAAIKDHSDV